MKIMQVIPVFGYGGAEIMCENLSIELINLNYEVVVVSLCNSPSSITNRMISAGVKVVFLNKQQGLDFSCIKDLRSVIKEERPDVIHTHLAALKYVALASVGYRCRLVHTLHSIAACEGPIWDQRFNYFLFKLQIVQPVALSSKVKDTVVKRYRLKPENVSVVFNGIDLDKCIKKTDYSITDKCTLIHIGRFERPKNHRGLIDAFEIFHNSYDNSELLLIGDGSEKKNVQEIVESKKLKDNVVFCGTTDNVYPLLNKADIFVLPSLWEGMPITIIEAMGTGLPIVASEVGGIPDMLINQETAILSKINSHEIAEDLLELAQNEELREYIGVNAQKAAMDFSSTTMAMNYTKVYRKEGENDNA